MPWTAHNLNLQYKMREHGGFRVYYLVANLIIPRSITGQQ